VRRRAHPLSLFVWTWHATLGAQTLDAPAASLVARIGWSRAAMLRRPPILPCTDGLFTLIANREFIKNALQQFTHRHRRHIRNSDMVAVWVAYSLRATWAQAVVGCLTLDRQLRGLLKLANNSGEYISPLAPARSPKKRKRTSKKQEALPRKIKRPR
jgi:hypothetical protein